MLTKQSTQLTIMCGHYPDFSKWSVGEAAGCMCLCVVGTVTCPVWVPLWTAKTTFLKIRNLFLKEKDRSDASYEQMLIIWGVCVVGTGVAITTPIWVPIWAIRKLYKKLNQKDTNQQKQLKTKKQFKSKKQTKTQIKK